MTPEEKELLLKDLSARIPYQPLCKIIDTEYDFCECDRSLGYSLRDFVGNNVIVKPYLRPMSSMTEEEKMKFHHVASLQRNYVGDNVFYTHWQMNDWLNKKMFDYRGLIPMGLALEAPEGMYKTE